MSRVRLLRVLGGFYAFSSLSNEPRPPSLLLHCANADVLFTDKYSQIKHLLRTSFLFTSSASCSYDYNEMSKRRFLPEQKPQVHSLLSKFSLENSSQQVAFLRLLGVRSMSIATLRQRGIAGCYIEKFDELKEPRMTISHHIVLHSLTEYADVNLMYIDLPINRTALPDNQYKEVMDIVDKYDENNISSLYYELSSLTDDDVDFLTNALFVAEDNANCASTFKEHLLIARGACQDYVDENMKLSRPPSA